MKRLMSYCEAMAEQSKGVLEEEQKKTFIKYLETVKKYFSVLKQQCDMGNAQAPAKEVLSEYSRKIDFLNDLINTQKLTSTTNNHVRLSTSSSQSHEQKNAEIHMRFRAKKKLEDGLRGQLMEAESSSSSQSSKGNQSRGKNTPRKSSSDPEMTTHEVLQEQQQLQTSITDEMALLSSSLKESSFRISKLITEGNRSLDELNVAADGNVSKIETENQRLKEHSAATAYSTLTTCILLLVITLMFIGTYMFMKMFRK